MEKDLELLKEIYTCTNSNSTTLNYLLPCVQNSSLRRAIITQINENDKINSDTKSEISNMGEKAPKNTFTVITAKVSTKINTAVDKSDSHIAELIINESNKGIIDITKKINSNQTAAPTCYNLARRYLKNEKDNIEIIKTYL